MNRVGKVVGELESGDAIGGDEQGQTARLVQPEIQIAIEVIEDFVHGEKLLFAETCRFQLAARITPKSSQGEPGALILTDLVRCQVDRDATGAAFLHQLVNS